MALVIPRWLPNAISVVRVALVPVWLALAFSLRARAAAGEAVTPWLSVGVLVALGASDLVDGFLARRFGLATNLGATLDAVADKLAQVATVTFLAFVSTAVFTPVPWWLWAALVLRDGLLLVGAALVWRRHGALQVEHRWHGKAASLLLFAVVVAANAAAPGPWVLGGAALAVLLIVPGTVSYLREGWRQLRAPKG